MSEVDRSGISAGADEEACPLASTIARRREGRDDGYGR